MNFAPPGNNSWAGEEEGGYFWAWVIVGDWHFGISPPWRQHFMARITNGWKLYRWERHGREPSFIRYLWPADLPSGPTRAVAQRGRYR